MVISAALLCMVGIVIFCCRSNNEIQITRVDYEVPNKELNREIVLVHISDLHNKSFGKGQERLMVELVNCHPDLICVTGDIVDRESFRNAETFIKKAVNTAPVFYVTGNHEYKTDNYPKIKKMLVRYGVNIVCDTCKNIEFGNCVLEIMGVDDPYKLRLESGYEAYMEEKLNNLMKMCTAQDTIRVLLSHRPELFELYDRYKLNIVLCGHAHGGQFRIFGKRGVIAPNQGIFPKYFQGVHRGKNIVEVISRGLGNSVIPLRINNKPEIVVVKIKKSG